MEMSMLILLGKKFTRFFVGRIFEGESTVPRVDTILVVSEYNTVVIFHIKCARNTSIVFLLQRCSRCQVSQLRNANEVDTNLV